MKPKKIISRVLMALVSAAPFTTTYSATFGGGKEDGVHMRLLETLVAGKQHEDIAMVRVTKNYWLNAYFPEEYSALKGNIHDNGHLWPKKYLDFTFKHGLLNSFIAEWFPIFRIRAFIKGGEIPGKHMPIRTDLFSIFKSSTDDIPALSSRIRIAVGLYGACMNGLHKNDYLLGIGSNYLKNRTREEHWGSKGSTEQRSYEKNRCDLLQDAAYTVVSGAYTVMRSITDFIKGDIQLKEMIDAHESKTREINDSDPAWLQDVDALNEIDPDYIPRDQAIRTKFEQYMQEIEMFFTHYTPTINGVEPVELCALELIDLGPENITSVPRDLKRIVDGL